METNVENNIADEIDEAKYIISKKKEIFRKQIRAKKHNELFHKKRFELLNQDKSSSKEPIDQMMSTENAMPSVLQEIIINQKHLQDYLDKICGDIKSQYLRNEVDSPDLAKNIKILKLYTSKIDEYPHIATCVLDNKIIQTLQQILTVPSLNIKNLQLDTAQIISNLTYSDADNIEKILENNLSLIDILVQVLKDQDNQYSTHAIYCLANMSQEYLDVRDEALKRGVSECIIEKYKQNKANKAFVEQLIWFIAIFSVRPHPYELIRGFIPILDEQLGLQGQSQENIKYITFALKNLSEGDEDKIQQILQMKNIKKLLYLSSKGQDKVPQNIYQIITNLTFGNVDQIMQLINLEVLDHLSYGFEKISKNIKIEVCQSINNLMCSSYQAIEHILNHRYLLSKILAYIQTGNFIYKKELILAFGNFCIHGTSSQINFMRQRGLFSILMDSFQYEDSEITLSTLEGIYRLLELGKEFQRSQQNYDGNQVLLAFENLGLSNSLMSLQKDPNERIYEKCEQIILNFYEYQ
ncbi:importin subunit alpha, putative (macronuclear) [Tetrahymena thermophila SB210]|uniref:Importin subunit alpha, putative n=1 Tax=Tetrahymena thermophila (strain SB210) TaxID=312017 RepID=Q22T86_TETTS|nr:importin subunit alpha, putative [Tetrahymena thermophila SB210]EAR88552.2 importin subunit alpha, putative [Tetrahymena thermophila SB210]|eukprot:XP_001008797.2 importin subunit alpha, putative [Tetrahymena thermophila SB210]